MTLADFFRTFEDHPGALPNFYPEAAKDVEDLMDFYHLTFQELREGKRKSPRLFKLPPYEQAQGPKRRQSALSLSKHSYLDRAHCG